MSENSNVKKSSKATAAAGNTVQTALTDQANDPIYQAVQGIVGQILANPTSLTPQAVDAMNQQGISEANAGANSFLKGRMEQLSGAGGGTGYRSGDARSAEYEAAARLGEGLATAHRNTQLAQAQSRIPDLQTAAQIGLALTNNAFGQKQQLANTQLGQASQFSTLGQIPSPLQQTMSGLGNIGGKVLTAGTGTGGVFKG